MAKNYFASDWHLSHHNIIKYDKRPFKHIGEMDTTIINNYNNTVKEGDNFYFLGDLCFNDRDTEYYLQQLKHGNLFFIKGNHDKRQTIQLYKKYGVYLGEQCKIKVNNQEIILNHYSMNVWDKCHHGSWHLFGHSHGSLPDNPNSLSFDVGCNIWNYTPLEFEQVKEIMSKKVFKPIDHHK